jgi:hypothetical protein
MNDESRVKMTPTYEIDLLNPMHPISKSRPTFALRGSTDSEESGESGTFERRKFGLRRHRPALVIFVRVRLVGSWQERFDTLFEHSMPQHKTARPHTRGR